MQKKLFEKFTFETSGLPLYRQLAEFICECIRNGVLKPGDRLPPQRDIAEALGVNLTTVTRAFNVLRQRGLVSSRAGGGSVIASNDDDLPDFPSAPSAESDLLDLTVNRPASARFLEELEQILARLRSDRRYSSLQDYQEPHGAPWAGAAIADWIVAIGALDQVDPRHIIVTNGAQHALACTLRAICRAGDVVLADAITYQGVAALCHSMDLELRGVPMDAHGMDPDAFEDACASFQPRAVFLVPTLHNPTTITLPDERRQRLGETAERHGVILIEDDVYRPLFDRPLKSLASLAADSTCYIGGFSKFVAPGSRLGFVLAPPAISPRIASALRVNCWCASPLHMLIATLLIEDGKLASIISEQRTELIARHSLLSKHLGGSQVLSYPTSPHAWIRLPEPWTAASFVAAARRRGVSVLSGDVFAVDREKIPHAVRINIGAPRSCGKLEDALAILADILNSEDRFAVIGI